MIILPAIKKFTTSFQTNQFFLLSRVFRSAVFFTLLCIILLNIFIYSSSPANQFALTLEVLEHPFDSAPHIAIAKLLFTQKKSTQSQHELALATSLHAYDRDVLGAEQPSALFTMWQSENQQLQGEINYWLDIIREHPTYRDAYIQISYLLKKNGNENLSQTYENAAGRIDPVLTIDK